MITGTANTAETFQRDLYKQRAAEEEMGKAADAADTSVLFFSAGASF